MHAQSKTCCNSQPRFLHLARPETKISHIVVARTASSNVRAGGWKCELRAFDPSEQLIDEGSLRRTVPLLLQVTDFGNL